MSIGRLLRRAMGTPADERRRAPRVRCRLNCTVRQDRKRFPARVLDVSEGGLCLLSPVQLPLKKPVVILIEVPPHGPVEVEAVTWHVHLVKSGRADKKTWSIGLGLTRAGSGFHALLPGQAEEVESDLTALCSDAEPADVEDGVGDPQLASIEISEAWEESSAEWEKLFAEAESLLADAEHSSGDCELQLYRVRVKASNGPRTRTIALSAASAEQAKILARADLDDSWRILEVLEA